MSESPRWMTMAEACLALNVCRRTIYRMVVAEVLPKPRRIPGFRATYFERRRFDDAVARHLRSRD
ncbi:MAG: helix-turn-helix domain-containing protein [Burkholderiales bacterium]|nr:helix-turn-helix domain-containing protein [Burkholderiales bacterium]